MNDEHSRKARRIYGYFDHNETGVQMLARLGFEYLPDSKQVRRLADGHVMARCAFVSDTNAWVAAECPDLDGAAFSAPVPEADVCPCCGKPPL